MPKLGFKHSKQSKLKMKKSKLGKLNNRFGTVHSDETKRKMRLSRNKWIKKNPNYNKGMQNHNWKGGISVDSSGYIIVKVYKHPYANNDYVKLHRLIIERYIGRYLNPEEVVHHIDKNIKNNNITNLMCFINNSAHRKFHKNAKSISENDIIFDGRENK